MLAGSPSPTSRLSRELRLRFHRRSCWTAVPPLSEVLAGGTARLWWRLSVQALLPILVEPRCLARSIPVVHVIMLLLSSLCLPLGWLSHFAWTRLAPGGTRLSRSRPLPVGVTILPSVEERSFCIGATFPSCDRKRLRSSLVPRCPLVRALYFSRRHT